jgi:hypothetical protein
MKGHFSGESVLLNEAREILDIYYYTKNPRIQFADRDDMRLTKEDIKDLEFFVFFMKNFQYTPEKKPSKFAQNSYEEISGDY